MQPAHPHAEHRILVRPVSSRREKRLFLTFPWRLHQDDPLWVPPLMPQQKERLDPTHNPVIAGGQLEMFLAWRDGEPVGTIAAAIDEKRNAEWDEHRAMFGFFECVADYTVAEALFDAVVDWAREREMESVWGPWMMDYEDSRGFLVKGWERPPVVMLAHNPPYYPRFAEQYGMTKAIRDSLGFAYDASLAMPEKLDRVASKLAKRSGVTIREVDLDRWDEELEIAVDVLTRGLAVLAEFDDMGRGFWDLERMAAHAEALKPVLDPAFVLIAEVDTYPVGWVMGLPDLNEAIKRANGLRYPWNYPQFWLAIRRQPRAISMKSIAVDPEYWNRGVDALLVHRFAKNALAKGYEWGDLSQTGEDNPMTPRLATRLGAEEYKRYRIYEIAVPA